MLCGCGSCARLYLVTKELGPIHAITGIPSHVNEEQNIWNSGASRGPNVTNVFASGIDIARWDKAVPQRLYARTTAWLNYEALINKLEQKLHVDWLFW
jgi:hypothetical protein